jgi:hypothetical protein
MKELTAQENKQKDYRPLSDGAGELHLPVADASELKEAKRMTEEEYKEFMESLESKRSRLLETYSFFDQSVQKISTQIMDTLQEKRLSEHEKLNLLIGAHKKLMDEIETVRKSRINPGTLMLMQKFLEQTWQLLIPIVLAGTLAGVTVPGLIEAQHFNATQTLPTNYTQNNIIFLNAGQQDTNNDVNHVWPNRYYSTMLGIAVAVFLALYVSIRIINYLLQQEVTELRRIGESQAAVQAQHLVYDSTRDATDAEKDYVLSMHGTGFPFLLSENQRRNQNEEEMFAAIESIKPSILHREDSKEGGPTFRFIPPSSGPTDLSPLSPPAPSSGDTPATTIPATSNNPITLMPPPPVQLSTNTYTLPSGRPAPVGSMRMFDVGTQTKTAHKARKGKGLDSSSTSSSSSSSSGSYRASSTSSAFGTK